MAPKMSKSCPKAVAIGERRSRRLQNLDPEPPEVDYLAEVDAAFFDAAFDQIHKANILKLEYDLIQRESESLRLQGRALVIEAAGLVTGPATEKLLGQARDAFVASRKCVKGMTRCNQENLRLRKNYGHYKTTVLKLRTKKLRSKKNK